VLDVVRRASCRAWLAADGFLGVPMAGAAREAWDGPVVALGAPRPGKAAGTGTGPRWDDLLDRRDLPSDAALDSRLRALTRTR